MTTTAEQEQVSRHYAEQASATSRKILRHIAPGGCMVRLNGREWFYGTLPLQPAFGPDCERMLADGYLGLHERGGGRDSFVANEGGGVMATQVLLIESERKPPKVWVSFSMEGSHYLLMREARELYQQLGKVLDKKAKVRK